MSLHVEAVSVCVGYSDFLAETIPHNHQLLDRWVIVTSKKDVATMELCRKWSLQCVVTDDFYRGGAPFNKGRGILKGIDQLAHSGWVLHLDADIVLPGAFRHTLQRCELDPAKLYGCDRILCRSWNDWQRLKASGWLTDQRDYHCRVKVAPDGFQIGTRWASPSYDWVPCGFFQLWNHHSDIYNGVHYKPYPAVGNDAARGDIQHGLQWDRQQRELLPSLVVAHLESERSKQGANWNGRTTAPFGPK